MWRHCFCFFLFFIRQPLSDPRQHVEYQTNVKSLFFFFSLDNPCPTQGNVLNIKLSEDEEIVVQTDGSQRKVVVDTYFQMNYGTGEWKRFRKYREAVS
jgi:hypothetical protein